MNQVSTLDNYDEVVSRAFEEAHHEIIDEFKLTHRQLRSVDSLANKGNMLHAGGATSLKGFIFTAIKPQFAHKFWNISYI